MGKKSLEEQANTRKELLTQLNSAPGQQRAEAEQTSQEKPDSEKSSKLAESADDVQPVDGYKMEDMTSQDEATDLSSSGIQWVASLFILLLVSLFYFGARRRR
jgi:cobaltochelatase CobN